MGAVLTMLVALAVDRWWGEPPVRWHPVVWMGHYLHTTGTWVQQRSRQATPVPDFKAFWLGALAWLAGAAIAFVAAWMLQGLLAAAQPLLPWWAAALATGLLLKPLLAWDLLHREVRAVEAALGESLQAGRERLRWLVSRDVGNLDEATVRASAIETLAENLNDSVIAPLFWFALLGLPGAALYRFANTADAMWGYRGIYPHNGQGRNWEWAGKWAARVDDGLGWLPARLTALLLAGVAGGMVWSRLRTEARRTASPNSGWPMASMALALGVCLHKPGVYALNGGAPAPQAADTQRALDLARNSLIALAGIALVALIFIAIGGDAPMVAGGWK